jgi:hypothetical protein
MPQLTQQPWPYLSFHTMMMMMMMMNGTPHGHAERMLGSVS